jgi:hypothetical protein
MLFCLLIIVLAICIFRWKYSKLDNESFVYETNCSSLDDYNNKMTKYITSVSHTTLDGSLGQHAMTFEDNRASIPELSSAHSSSSNKKRYNKLDTYKSNVEKFYQNCLNNISKKVSDTENTFNREFKNYI